eukprot:TRINITY_DN4899_c0_g3_i3.p1 TRINITY_DN4899_c0_g3~~TRINITY_DN4899_c0_g3_i3.p1  ORF type:complete len:513 (+),score=44.78 TRINITY_DN4899_c0_g3_i3:257-1795(+)
MGIISLVLFLWGIHCVTVQGHTLNATHQFYFGLDPRPIPVHAHSSDKDAAKDLRIYVYHLVDAARALRFWYRSHKEECHLCSCVSLEPCPVRGFAHLLDYVAEVTLLLKFLDVGRLVGEDEPADLFIVPAFEGTMEYLWHYGLGQPLPKHPSGLHRLHRSTAARHVILMTNDRSKLKPHWMGAKWQEMAQPVRLHLGPAACRGDVLVPPPKHVLAPPASSSTGRDLWVTISGGQGQWRPFRFLMERFSERFVLSEEGMRRCRRLGAARHPLPSACVFQVTGKPAGVERLIALAAGRHTPAHSSLLGRSRVCFLTPGDLPAQKRLFDSIHAGCIPAVFDFGFAPNNYSKGEHDYQWDRVWWAGLTRKGATWWQSLPFPDVIDYTKLVITIPWRTYCLKTFMQALADIPEEEITRREQGLARASQLLSYDPTGETVDAFSLVLRAVLDHVRSSHINDPDNSSSGCQRTFDPYGHLCCPNPAIPQWNRSAFAHLCPIVGPLEDARCKCVDDHDPI